MTLQWSNCYVSSLHKWQGGSWDHRDWRTAEMWPCIIAETAIESCIVRVFERNVIVLAMGVASLSSASGESFSYGILWQFHYLSLCCPKSLFPRILGDKRMFITMDTVVQIMRTVKQYTYLSKLANKNIYDRYDGRKGQVLEDMMELQFQVLGQIWGYYFRWLEWGPGYECASQWLNKMSAWQTWNPTVTGLWNKGETDGQREKRGKQLVSTSDWSALLRVRHSQHSVESISLYKATCLTSWSLHYLNLYSGSGNTFLVTLQDGLKASRKRRDRCKGWLCVKSSTDVFIHLTAR